MNDSKKSNKKVGSSIDSLLKEISVLHNQAEIVRSKKESEGGYFNVFNTLGLKTEEVRLHSAFLAELLNPNGSHGLSDTFLKLFIEEVKLPDNYINTQKVSSEKIKERYIGRVTKTEGGIIDIIVEDGKKALIIENKIYAEDQKNQLVRYSNYGKKSFPNGFKLLYLTLDGHEASNVSVGSTKTDYTPISYDKEIINWLEKCIEASNEKELINTALIQYLELIKQITNRDMNTQFKKQLIEKMVLPENAISVSEILSVKDDWFDKLLEVYLWKPLELFAKERGMIFEKYIAYNEESGAWIRKQEWNNYGIFIWSENKRDWIDMFVGISYYKSPKQGEKIIQRNYRQLDCLKERPVMNWPYGWEYLPEEIRTWNDSIVPLIVKGEVVKYIQEKFEVIISEIDECSLAMP